MVCQAPNSMFPVCFCPTVTLLQHSIFAVRPVVTPGPAQDLTSSMFKWMKVKPVDLQRYVSYSFELFYVVKNWFLTSNLTPAPIEKASCY